METEPVEENELKQKVVNELKTEVNRLTASDRRLIKAYLGYIPVKNVHEGTRTRADACAYVENSLWPENPLSQEQKTEEELFDLDVYTLDDAPDIPTIFNNAVDELAVMFKEASEFSDRQQAGVVRSFQVLFFFLIFCCCCCCFRCYFSILLNHLFFSSFF